AHWDLAARRAGVPLRSLLGSAGNTTVKTYASGVNHPGIAETFARARDKGYRRFKIKFAFGEKQDFRNLAEAYDCMEKGEELAVDANQGWDLPAALDQVRKLQDYPLFWIEEPLRCDRPLGEWKELASTSRIPLAAGENLRSRESFTAAVSSGALGVVQPDVCKWGGLSVCKELAVEILRAKRRYCPHFLGSGIGLLASAHLLASVGGDGLLEVDCTPSPMRELLAQPFPAVEEGNLHLPDAPGLGVDPDLEGAKKYITRYQEIR
ncbi:MAG: mandelate racemase/muconate lactonizing enzyme family protein, partial [Desulfovibrio sp.]|nr:mandelate racemase/muconate lactonizing enzyme family protein [Desulfovibrio sp.]